jgi:hypothetical protein
MEAIRVYISIRLHGFTYQKTGFLLSDIPDLTMLFVFVNEIKKNLVPLPLT